MLEDLQRLPEGDLTWVKKNGDNLSGGQRQRISLARAVFKNAGIYLLDDPMSAIDPCLRVRIFDQIFGNRGLLRKKTRIIITKDQRFLPKLDYIIVMKNKVSSFSSPKKYTFYSYNYTKRQDKSIFHILSLWTPKQNIYIFWDFTLVASV